MELKFYILLAKNYLLASLWKCFLVDQVILLFEQKRNNIIHELAIGFKLHI